MDPDPQPRWPRAPSTEELWWYLFGDPRNPTDRGMLGRLEDQLVELSSRMGRLTRMGWAILLLLLGALLTAAANLIHH